MICMINTSSTKKKKHCHPIRVRYDVTKMSMDGSDGCYLQENRGSRTV